jgi:hypothetical protein
MVTFRYDPAAAFQVSGITNDFAGANNYRPNVTCDPYASTKSVTGWFNPACVTIPTDPSQPFGNAKRNSVRGPNYWTVDFAITKQVELTRPGAGTAAARGVQFVQPRQLRTAEQRP